MSTEPDFEAIGLFEARYVAFLETITHLRPRLHRYCARMTGSVLDGEDVMQEAVFEAYRKLDRFDDSRPLSPWLFRIAHNRCIDFLRRREVREEAEAAAMAPRPGAARRAAGARPWPRARTPGDQPSTQGESLRPVEGRVRLFARGNCPIGRLHGRRCESRRLLDLAKSAPYATRLDQCTAAAAGRGVFGSPTMFVGGEMFFGNDRLDFVAEALRSAA